MAATFKKDFNNGDEWILKEIETTLVRKVPESHGEQISKEIAGNFIIMIPKSYLVKKQLTVEKLGLNINTASPFTKKDALATIQTIKNNYSQFSQDDWEFLSTKNRGVFSKSSKK